MRLTILIVTVLGAAAPVVAEPARDAGEPDDAPRARSQWVFDYGMQQRWLGDGSAVALAEGGLFGGRVSAGRRILTLPGPRGAMDVSGFARFGVATGHGQLFQALDTRLRQFLFTAGARLDSRVVWRLRAHVQLELGAARTDVVIGDELGPMAPVVDHGWGFAGAATAGTELDLWRRRTRHAALYADLGYLVTAPVTIRAFPGDRPDEDLSIPTTYWSLGELDTRGVLLSFGVRGGF